MKRNKPQGNKTIIFFNLPIHAGRGCGKPMTMFAIAQFHLNNLPTIINAQRTQNPYHRYWEGSFYGAWVGFPKIKHKFIMKIIHFLYKHFSNEKKIMHSHNFSKHTGEKPDG